MSGPSGSGKTTLHKALLGSPQFKKILVKSISATTRAPRPGEKKGKDYLFLSRELFEKRISRGYFLEWERVFDNYYGTPKQQVLKLLKAGKYVLLCIDVKGARQVKADFPDAVRIFIKTPSMKVLQDRLRERASETHQSLQLRLKVARAELKEGKTYDYVLTNGRLDKALRDLSRIISQVTG
jgi:guanylate kinase